MKKILDGSHNIPKFCDQNNICEKFSERRKRDL